MSMVFWFYISTCLNDSNIKQDLEKKTMKPISNPDVSDRAQRIGSKVWPDGVNFRWEVFKQIFWKINDLKQLRKLRGYFLM